MSVLSLTLLSRAHCHPGVMFSVSFEPVANVVRSGPVSPGSKSRTNAASCTFAGRGLFTVGSFAPAAVNNSSQSSGCRFAWLTMSPSSSKPLSWTANAFPTISIEPTSATSIAASIQRFRSNPLSKCRWIELIVALLHKRSCSNHLPQRRTLREL